MRVTTVVSRRLELVLDARVEIERQHVAIAMVLTLCGTSYVLWIDQRKRGCQCSSMMHEEPRTGTELGETSWFHPRHYHVQ